MRRHPEVTCIGEAIVDFVSTTSGVLLGDAPAFLKAAGGAPANVAVGLARLGTRSAFVGVVGDDSFGHFLEKELRKNGVDTRGMLFDRERKTRLAFVSLTASGERDFEFWERHPADEHLRKVGTDHIPQRAIVHISSFMLLKNPARSAVLRVAELSRRRKCLVSFDPNLRLALWTSPAEARRLNLRMVKCSDILRLNDEEALFLTRKRTIEDAAAELRSLGPRLVVTTLGEKGCYAQTAAAAVHVPGFSVRSVDTTGCGDAFLAALLHGIQKRKSGLDDLTSAALQQICRYANAVGALTSLHHGAMAAIPSTEAVQEFLNASET